MIIIIWIKSLSPFKHLLLNSLYMYLIYTGFTTMAWNVRISMNIINSVWGSPIKTQKQVDDSIDDDDSCSVLLIEYSG